MRWLPATMREFYTSRSIPADDPWLRRLGVNLSKKLKLGIQSELTSAIQNDPVFGKIEMFKCDLEMAIMQEEYDARRANEAP